MDVFYFTNGTRSTAYASESILDALKFDAATILRRAEVPNNTEFNYKGVVEIENLAYSEQVDVSDALQEFVIKRVRAKRGKMNKYLTQAERNVLQSFLNKDDNNPSQEVRNLNAAMKVKTKRDTSIDDREGHFVVYALDTLISSKSYAVKAAWIADLISECEHKTSPKGTEKDKVETELNKAIKKQTGWNI